MLTNVNRNSYLEIIEEVYSKSLITNVIRYLLIFLSLKKADFHVDYGMRKNLYDYVQNKIHPTLCKHIH